MGRRSRWWLALIVCAAATLGCSRSHPKPGVGRSDSDGPSASVQLNTTQYRLSGPYAYGNLAVFLIHSSQQDQREFLTLDEGLERGLVKVSEKPDATVNELLIENQSELPLFLQEGDRLYGGKQDRTVFASLVIPPKSGPMPIPVFCIEPGRWSAAASGERFRKGDNPALAPLQVRNAAKLAQDQSLVWNEVAVVRGMFGNFFLLEPPQSSGASASNGLQSTSLNELFESPAVLKLCQEYAQALERVLDDKPDAVGVAIAVKGRFVEVNVYPNHRLLRRMYSRLIQSHALDAAAREDKGTTAPVPTQEELVQLLTAEVPAKNKRTQQINQANRLEIIELGVPEKESGQLVQCVSYFEDREVHRQWVRGVGVAEEQRRQVPPTGPANNRLFDNPVNQLLPRP